MTLYDIELLFEEYHITFDRNENVAYMSEPDDEWQSEVWSVYIKNIPEIANQTTCIFDDEDIMFQLRLGIVLEQFHQDARLLGIWFHGTQTYPRLVDTYKHSEIICKVET